MSVSMIQAAAAALYGAASAAFGLWLARSGLLSPLEATLSGSVTALAAWQIHAALLNASERRVRDAEVARLQEAQHMLADGLELLRAEMGSLTYSYESTARERTQRLVGEVRVLEGLIERLGAEGNGTSQPIFARTIDATQGDEGAASGPEGPGHEVLDAIRSALEDNRVDLHLQPIVSLPQRRLRFFEVLTRLRREDGTLIMPADYLSPAEDAGLISVIDNLLLFRSVQIVRRLPPRDRHMALMCNMSARTLQDGAFFRQFLDFMAEQRDLAHQIVFEFPQSAIDFAGPEDMRHLAELADLGFRFSMDNVSGLDLDPHALNRRNIRFVKIPASLLLDRRAAEGASIDTADIKALFRRHGVDLIVEKIEDERTVVEILEYDVDYGQGYLFGMPRPIRDAYAAA